MSKKDKKEIQFEQPSDILLLFDKYIIYIIAFMVLTILATGYLFLLKPKIDDISSIETETTESEDRRLGNEELLNDLRELEAEYRDIINNRQSDLVFLKKMIPQGTQEAEFFLLADRLAKKYGFTLADIDINTNPLKDKKNKDASTDTEGAAQAETVTVESVLASSGIKASVVKLSVSRTVFEGEGVLGEEIYSDFKDYLAGLERNIRLLDVQALSFSSVDAVTSEEITYTFDLDLITYYQ